ncbi:leucine-rich repeat domain-containing protein [Prevotella falsenii]|uniref:leucine-rich repeat domain-containing protein n=1 Tax=Prevotella falsenii TaxID=515414 RepID=UPI0004681E0E|nr:leucine-rich repeat domain-containing protein [Prevotella falsenii]
MRAYNVGDVIDVGGISYKITKVSTAASGTVTPGEVYVSTGTTKTGAITIPKKITDDYGTEYNVIGVEPIAFNIEGVTSVTLPEGIESIQNGAFSESPDLVSFNIPASVTKLGINLITNSPKVNKITVASTNVTWKDIDGVLCKKDGSLILYPQGKTATSYNVPAEIKTLEVGAFTNCNNLTSINLGSSTTMNGIVFNRCKELTSLNFPAQMTNIPADKGFYSECDKLATFTVVAGNPNYSADNGILFDKQKKELISSPQGKEFTDGSYNIPTSVKKIATRAFFRSKLEKITIPSGVELADRAFMYAKLKEVTISEGVTKIGDRAFYGSELLKVNVPASATDLGHNIFLSCQRMTEITVNAGNTKYESENGVMFTKGKKTLYAFPCNQKPGEQYTIPAVVETIGLYAFCNVRKTVDQHIPNTVKRLESGAFEGSEYSKIIFDATSQVSYIGSSAFRSLKNVTELTIPASVKEMGYEVAYGCKNLQTLNFDANSQLNKMADRAFVGCANLKTVNIGANSKIPLGKEAFKDCSALTTVNADTKSLKSIGDNAFLNCKSLVNLNIENSGLETIGTRAFQNCTALTEVKMPASLTTIGESAFTECSKLANVTFPDNSQLEKIGRNAFQNSAITGIKLPESLKTLGVESFHSCKKLESIDIPAGTTNVASQAFTSCSKLVSINVHKDNEKYTSLDGMLVSKDKTRLMTFPPGKANSRYTRVPSFITAIDSAFYSCVELTNVTIPKTVTEIGDFAFSNTKNLTSISFLGDIPKLEDRAFLNTDVTKITLFVRKRWFEDSNNATTIANMKTKGFKDIHPSFIAPNPDYDRGIEYFPTSINTVGVIAFDTPRNSVIIPEKVNEKYNGTTNTYEVATVLDYAFEDNQATETVVFLGDLEEIGLNAFSKKSTSGENNKIKNIYFVDNTVPNMASVSFKTPNYYPFTDNQNIYVKQSKVAAYKDKWQIDNHTLNITHEIPQITNKNGGTVCFPFDVKYPTGKDANDIKPYVPVDYTYAYAASNPIVRAYSLDDYYVPAYVGALIRSKKTDNVTSYCQMDEDQMHKEDKLQAVGYNKNAENRMVEAVEDVSITNEPGFQYYAFSKKYGKFVKVMDGVKIPYFKAYFRLKNSPTSPAKGFSIVFDDEDVPAGIDGITEFGKDNDNAPYYNLNGVQVSKPSKGVYIHNGKKVIIK